MADTYLKVKPGNLATVKHDAAGDSTEGLYVAGTKVVGPQQTGIADISNSATGTQIATAVNGIIAALEAHGLLATV